MRATIRKDFPADRRDEAMTLSGELKQRPPGRPKGKTKPTMAKLERIAQLERDGLTLYAIAKEIAEDYGKLRKFLSDNRDDYQKIMRVHK